ncbi:MAG: ketoacyl-ACP synthase III [Lachnoclostridium sp.]|nr:ketoacyl-ACP synthase III [Lachnospira sp.]MCM1247565.1 ketoacyl-ACP synthase III [Lachnoclostridium sp.]
MIGVIKGTGACLPEKILDNNTLSQWMDTSDEWIKERTGIKTRHVVENETTVSMAAEAAKRALENAGVDAEEIDLIIVSTVSSNVVLPSTACEVQKSIGAVNAVSFDLNAACTGFLFALNTAQTYFYANLIKKALIIGAESLSNLMDWGDRSTAILFGDGAGAVVMTAEEGEFPAMVMHSDGAKGNVLTCRSRFLKGGITQDTHSEDLYIRMNGQEVFKFAVRQVPRCIEELLEKCRMTADEIDYYILHQANERIVESIAKRLKADISRFPMNLMNYGNTSSASMPILLDEVNRKGMLKKGMKLVLAGFGAGLTWGAAYMEWAAAGADN